MTHLRSAKDQAKQRLTKTSNPRGGGSLLFEALIDHDPSVASILAFVSSLPFQITVTLTKYHNPLRSIYLRPDEHTDEQHAGESEALAKTRRRRLLVVANTRRQDSDAASTSFGKSS